MHSSAEVAAGPDNLQSIRSNQWNDDGEKSGPLATPLHLKTTRSQADRETPSCDDPPQTDLTCPDGVPRNRSPHLGRDWGRRCAAHGGVELS